MAPRDDLEAKRLGRPRDTDSAMTRRRILDVARNAFADGGYEAATNRELAKAVGITAGALYHYFGSKLDLYLAVNADVQSLVQERIDIGMQDRVGFIDRFDAVLDTVRELNREDPTLAAFVGAARADSRRHSEIRSRLKDVAAWNREFVGGLVAAGVDSGEVDAAHAPLLAELVTTLLVGLTDGVSSDADRHQRAIESIKMALTGELIRPVGERK